MQETHHIPIEGLINQNGFLTMPKVPTDDYIPGVILISGPIVAGGEEGHPADIRAPLKEKKE